MPQQTSKTFARALVAITLLAGGTWGCGLIKSAESDKVLAATVLATPNYDFSFLLPDASLPSLPFDAGIPTFTPALPSETVAQVFFGQRASDPTAQPTGIAGASVKLSINGTSFDIADQGQGNYSLTSLDNSAFVYQPNVTYEITVTNGSDTFTGSVTGPDKDPIEQFAAQAAAHPGVPMTQQTNAPLLLTRTNAEDVAFTTVFPVALAGQGQPTYTDMPTTPLDLLDLIANDGPWRTKVITIPGANDPAGRTAAFPYAGTYYAVTVVAVKKGSTSNNLFTASAFLVGKADMYVVVTP
jgi:hypothetical protein